MCMCISGWVYNRTHTQIHEYSDKTETRDALQQLVLSDDAKSGSDRFHLPCLNLNLPRCGMSNSLRTNGICQPTSKCFLLLSLPLTKGCSPTQAPKYLLYPLLFACPLCETLHCKCLTILLQVRQCWQIFLKKWFKVFFYIPECFVNGKCDICCLKSKSELALLALYVCTHNFSLA